MSEWQPIETINKKADEIIIAYLDGSALSVASGYYLKYAPLYDYEKCFWYNAEGIMTYGGNCFGVPLSRCMAWMPLPKPPEVKDE